MMLLLLILHIVIVPVIWIAFALKRYEWHCSDKCKHKQNYIPSMQIRFWQNVCVYLHATWLGKLNKWKISNWIVNDFWRQTQCKSRILCDELNSFGPLCAYMCLRVSASKNQFIFHSSRALIYGSVESQFIHEKKNQKWKISNNVQCSRTMESFKFRIYCDLIIE